MQINRGTVFCALFLFFSLGYKLSPSVCDRHIWIPTLMGEEMDLTGRSKRGFLGLTWKLRVLRGHPRLKDNLLAGHTSLSSEV